MDASQNRHDLDENTCVNIFPSEIVIRGGRQGLRGAGASLMSDREGAVSECAAFQGHGSPCQTWDKGNFTISVERMNYKSSRERNPRVPKKAE